MGENAGLQLSSTPTKSAALMKTHTKQNRVLNTAILFFKRAASVVVVEQKTHKDERFKISMPVYMEIRVHR